MNENNRNVKPLSPFVLWCQKVIPLAFDESMSYYECLCALYKHIIELDSAVNENADAVTELQNYVENYFENLDVQQEINNKLDEMATDGTLARIINEEIFQDLNDEITLLHDETSANADDITTLQNQVQNIQATVTTEMVVFGDSWSDLNNEDSIWSLVCSSSLRLNLHNYAVDGSGFVHPSNNLIDAQITTAENDDTYDKNLVKYVVLCGGINDYNNSVDINDLKAGIVSAYNRCKLIFPNAKIIYVNNFKYPYTNAQSAYWYGIQYNLSTSGINVLNQDGYYKKEYFNSTLFHLTQAGQCVFASNILATLSGGQIKNEGVKITFQTSKGYLYLKRIDNLIIYYIYVTNLLNTDTAETVVLNSEMCWVDAFQVTILGDSQPEFALAVAQINSNNTILTARNQARTVELIFKGVMPIIQSDT